MEDKKATIIDKVRPDILMPPHIADKLFHLIAGEWQPDTSQQEQLVEHLTECSFCRTFLIVLLSADQEYEKANSTPDAPIHSLLTRFATIHHEIEARDYEQMGAYAEAIIAVGKKAANKRFPELAEHVRSCSSCKSMLEDTLAFLSGSEEIDNGDESFHRASGKATRGQ